jgi:Na+/H+ antiporter NhaC
LPLPWLELICLHIRYMTLTTIPTYVITMILFIVLGLSVDIMESILKHYQQTLKLHTISLCYLRCLLLLAYY